MAVEVLFLVENTTNIPGIKGEYGLSLLVKIDGRGILFDAGLAEAACHNMKVMGIQPGDIEEVALSHGHFDHTGGLGPVLDYIGGRKVYLHPDALLPKFVQWENTKRYIGMPERSELEKLGAEFVLSREPLELMPGLMITGEVPRTNDFEDTGGDFWTTKEGKDIPDLLLDDQSLIIDRPEGLIVISGCAHSGMINTLDFAVKLTGRKKIQAWVGGTHLMTAKESRLAKTIDKLKAYDIEKIVIAHCTGLYPTLRMSSELGSRVVKGESGSRFIFA